MEINNLKEEKLLNISLTNPINPASFGNSDKASITPLRGRTIEHQKGKTIEIVKEDGFFHPHPTQINDSQLDAICGNIIFG
ncbi:hypothetical protein NQ314_013562 [Rhamnusium bicolor]|uniref:Uncharacterized protein n=1 Tax=Rhamnusium bicolor TaxID=1586634 RepID=A0AAV8X687_9CUCU|nr:hypothetical protein NQ314_013562 [Rhamnusium bicolor]